MILQLVGMYRNGYENSNRHYAKASFSLHGLHTMPMTLSLEKPKPPLTRRGLIDQSDLHYGKILGHRLGQCMAGSQRIWPLLTVQVGCIDSSEQYTIL